MLPLLIRLCLFSAQPQDIPSSNSWLKIALIAAIVVQIAGNMLFAEQRAIAIGFAQIGLLGAELWLLLRLFSFPGRWLQTATATFGVAAILNTLALPLLTFIDPTAETLSSALVLALLIDLWFYAVLAYILKNALEISLSLASIITLVMLMVLILTLMYLFGNPQP